MREGGDEEGRCWCVMASRAPLATPLPTLRPTPHPSTHPQPTSAPTRPRRPTNRTTLQPTDTEDLVMHGAAWLM
ncbi:hypothetical protein Pcinc_036624 [Petrolisthes cinctipes]|uniref:Uncharacterized protein n=1 Tax=Petrolisthes cinctipes TaxID=88211 RepID=A0AAE1BUF7_PETCI|nr:hypothetical protein Pcinc_036624 [Petrolisthes cinctipes]